MFEFWKLEPDTVFTGHAIALEPNEDYRNQPAINTIKKLKLYAESLRFGNSPYILYGILVYLKVLLDYQLYMVVYIC